MDALGRHILVELYDCKAELLNDVVAVEQLMAAAAEAADATLINATFHHFSPYGVSGVIVVQESHLAIHTWPEARYAAVDLFTCGGSTRPWEAFAVLKAGLEAGNSSAMEIQRGALALLPISDLAPYTETAEASPSVVPSYRRDCWFTERNDSLALSLKHQGDRLQYTRSSFQKIELYETMAYGKMLALDGRIVLTEKDEYIYHEMSTHVPMQLCPDARKVLVIGGGDGGTMRELFRYDQLREVRAVEIDEEVVKLARRHFHDWWEWEKDPRFECVIADARTYIQQQNDRYDLIIIDAPIAIGPEQGHFGRDFFQELNQKLEPGGLLLAQTYSPRFQEVLFCRSVEMLQDLFMTVSPFLVPIPTYPGGLWSFALCSLDDTMPTLKVEHTDQFVKNQGLRYYNPAVHQAAFALPNDLRELVD